MTVFGDVAVVTEAVTELLGFVYNARKGSRLLAVFVNGFS